MGVFAVGVTAFSFADGQAIAIKLGSQIDRLIVNITRNISLINGMNENVNITFDDVKDPNGEIYRGIVPRDIETEVPSRVKNKAVDLLCLRDRCEEELSMVKREMSSVVSFFVRQIEIIRSFTGEEASSDEQRGVRSLAIELMTCYQNRIKMVNELWSGLIFFPMREDDVETFQLVQGSPSNDDDLRIDYAEEDLTINT